jgi:hypothetical protein
MKFLRFIFVASATVAVIFSFNSCKKITEDQIINGLWRIETIHANGSTFNLLSELPHYPEGNDCCYYKLNFERDGIVIAYYLTYDTLNSVEAGNWELNSGNQISLKVGSFIDGTFKIEKPTLKHWTLTSAFNHIRYYDLTNPLLDTAVTNIDMKKI